MENYIEYLKKSLNGSHNDIATALYEKYKENFICVSIPNKTWYQFINNRWEKIDHEVLREIFFSSIKSSFQNMTTKLLEEMSLENNEDIKSLKKKLTAVQKIYNKCNSINFKNNIMLDCMEVFYKKKDQIQETKQEDIDDLKFLLYLEKVKNKMYVNIIKRHIDNI